VSDGLEEGSSFPLGATLSPAGVNFSVFSKHATGVQLLLSEEVVVLTAVVVYQTVTGTTAEYPEPAEFDTCTT